MDVQMGGTSRYGKGYNKKRRYTKYSRRYQKGKYSNTPYRLRPAMNSDRTTAKMTYFISVPASNSTSFGRLGINVDGVW